MSNLADYYFGDDTTTATATTTDSDSLGGGGSSGGSISVLRDHNHNHNHSPINHNHSPINHNHNRTQTEATATTTEETSNTSVIVPLPLLDDFNDDIEKDLNRPDLVEELLSKQIFNLSLKDRTDYQEEIHGVKCLAPDESQQLLEESLLKFNILLKYDNDTIPLHEKYAYLQAISMQQQQFEQPFEQSFEQQFEQPFEQHQSQQQSHQQSYNSNISYSNSSCYYTLSNEFKIRFLRCELFDITKAVLRYVKWLNLVVEMFGLYALERPIRLNSDDFTREEITYFKKGRYQLLPFRDRGTGRRILCIFPDKEWENIPPKIRNKIIMYILYVVGNDIDCQRKGIVIVGWLDKTFENQNISAQPVLHKKDHHLTTVRVSAIHICTPDTPFYRFRRAVIAMRIAQLRTRLNIHIGEPIELKYILQGYGIPNDDIPITFTGTIKTIYHKQWMKLRNTIENRNNEQNNHINEDLDSSNSNSSGTTTKMNMIIESPYLNDIIFRKGKSFMYNDGNIMLRSLVELRTKEQFYWNEHNIIIGNSNKIDISGGPPKTRTLITGIIDDIKIITKGGRFLNWNEQDHYWEELIDGSSCLNTGSSSSSSSSSNANNANANANANANNNNHSNDIYIKIEYLIRAIRRSEKKKQQQQQQVSQS